LKTSKNFNLKEINYFKNVKINVPLIIRMLTFSPVFNHGARSISAFIYVHVIVLYPSPPTALSLVSKDKNH
jgi:hypothetical protein